MSMDFTYRAYDKKEKKWLLGYEPKKEGGFSLYGECVLMGEWGNVLNEYLFDRNGHNADDLVVMQSTGRRDKNGVLIYGGDIVSFTRPVGNWTGKTMKSIHKIYFEQGICAFVMGYVGQYIKFRDGRSYEYEILGNIYDNPELVK